MRSSPIAKSLFCLCFAIVALCPARAGVLPPVMNPPPAEKLSAFTRIELSSIQMGAPYAGKGSNDKALAVMQKEFTDKMSAPIAAWKTAGEKNANARTLVIEPKVEEIRYVSGAARFWAGGLPGDSFLLVSLKLTEKETGKVIATAMFYAKADRRGAGWTVGGTDRAMLGRTATNMAAYLTGNYDTLVGGRSGTDPR
jgi:hypothetical protein